MITEVELPMHWDVEREPGRWRILISTSFLCVMRQVSKKTR